jgi:5'-nucleotidase
LNGQNGQGMRILITNDDGINAPGLRVLETIAARIAGPGGEVWTVAPAFEQSGVGHCISYTHPTMLAKMAERRYAAEGSPADCVLAGIHEVMKDRRPDLVLSGVNRGNNAAENVLYSGTVGGAMEAALQNLPAIALSQFYGPENVDLDNPFEAAAEYGERVVRDLLDKGIWDTGGYRVFYNVNFPPIPAAGVQGVKVAAQGFRRDTVFGVEPHISPSGRLFFWIKGGPQHNPSLPGTDAAVNLEGYISVTPLRADLTAHDVMDELRGRLG